MLYPFVRDGLDKSGNVYSVQINNLELVAVQYGNRIHKTSLQINYKPQEFEAQLIKNVLTTSPFVDAFTIKAYKPGKRLEEAIDVSSMSVFGLFQSYVEIVDRCFPSTLAAVESLGARPLKIKTGSTLQHSLSLHFGRITTEGIDHAYRHLHEGMLFPHVEITDGNHYVHVKQKSDGDHQIRLKIEGRVSERDFEWLEKSLIAVRPQGLRF